MPSHVKAGISADTLLDGAAIGLLPPREAASKIRLPAPFAPAIAVESVSLDVFSGSARFFFVA